MAIARRQSCGLIGVVVGLLGIASGTILGTESEFQPGHSYFGRSNYVEYIAGDMPVIISAPHGGRLAPAEIPDRTSSEDNDDFATITDAYTMELALAVQQVFREYFSHCPHVILCRLKRTKLDCNRAIDEGAGTNGSARQAWQEFQGFITTARQTVLASARAGLYVDLHGQSHPVKRMELGYLLTARQLTNSDAVLSQPAYAAQSSLHALASTAGLPFPELLRGSNSLGGLLAALGYPSVPAPLMPDPGSGTNPIVCPGDGNPYYGGGYNLRMHSSAGRGGRIDGLQLEANLAGVRDSAAHRTNFARAFAQALDSFFTNHYGISLKAGVIHHKR